MLEPDLLCDLPNRQLMFRKRIPGKPSAASSRRNPIDIRMRQNNRDGPIPLIKKLLQILPRPFLIKRHHHMHSLPTNPLHNPLPPQIQLPMRSQTRIRLPNLLTLEYQCMFRLFRV